MSVWREAIVSTAMSHPTMCECRVCQAAAGDKELMLELVTEAMFARRGPEDGSPKANQKEES